MWKTTAQAVNYEKTDAVDHSKTLGLINSFLVDTTEFLNRFSTVCSQRLSEVSSSLQRLEVTMAILESKLESIPGLESVNADTVIQRPTQNAPSAAADNGPPLPDAGDDDNPPMPMVEEDEAEAVPEVESNAIAYKDDPRYAHYFKMKRLGVPEPNIIAKMRSEGVEDTSIISRPDDPSDLPATSLMGGSESEEENSDGDWD